MTLTLSELDAVASELDNALAGGTLREIRQPDEATLLLEFETKGKRQRILVSIRPRVSRIHLTARGLPPAGPPTRFEARLREELLGTRLESVKPLYRDRVLGLAFKRGDEGRGLLFECSGHHPNLYLADERTVVLAMMGPSHSHRRDLRPGKPYVRPIRHEGDDVEALRFVAGRGGYSRAIEDFYAADEAREARHGEANRIRAALRDEEERAARLVHGLERDLARASEVSPGKGERPERLALRRPEIIARLGEARARVQALAAAVAALAAATPGDEAIAKGQALLKTVRPVDPSALAGGGGNRPYRTFRSNQGHPILVGKGRRENLELTFRIATDGDLWLHVEGTAGAHVLVPGAQQDLPFETILEAALLAVHFSEADPEREHVVTATHRRNVRPVEGRGGGTGEVRVIRGQEVRVRPAPQWVKKLLASEDFGEAAQAARPAREREDRSQVDRRPRREGPPGPRGPSAGRGGPPPARAKPPAPPAGRRRVVYGRGGTDDPTVPRPRAARKPRD